METIKNKCTLTDDELVEKAREWIRKLTKTGGRAWSLSVPADFNRDPDFIFDELCRRFIGAKNTEQQVEVDNLPTCNRPAQCAKGMGEKCYSGLDCPDKGVAT